MNRKVLSTILIIAAVTMIGCSNNQANPKSKVSTSIQSKNNNVAKDSSNTKSDSTSKDSTRVNGTSTEKKAAYSIVKNTYKINNITINYPGIKGLENGSNEETINQLIKEDALSYISKNLDDKLSLEINYKITLANEKLLSIQYSGQANAKDASHPTNIFYTTNIDMKNKRTLRLSDLVTINKNFAQSFRNGKFIDWMQTDSSDDSKKVQEAVENYISNINDNDLMEWFNKADYKDTARNPFLTYCYLTKDSIGISINVPHAIGEHAEYEVKYKDIANNINTKNEIGKSLLNY